MFNQADEDDLRRLVKEGKSEVMQIFQTDDDKSAIAAIREKAR